MNESLRNLTGQEANRWGNDWTQAHLISSYILLHLVTSFLCDLLISSRENLPSSSGFAGFLPPTACSICVRLQDVEVGDIRFNAETV